MNEIETIIEVAKEVVEEAIRAGADHKQCFDFLSGKFGTANTRLILASIALDRGMEKEAAAYLNNF